MRPATGDLKMEVWTSRSPATTARGRPTLTERIFIVGAEPRAPAHSLEQERLRSSRIRLCFGSSGQQQPEAIAVGDRPAMRCQRCRKRRVEHVEAHWMLNCVNKGEKFPPASTLACA